MSELSLIAAMVLAMLVACISMVSENALGVAQSILMDRVNPTYQVSDFSAKFIKP